MVLIMRVVSSLTVQLESSSVTGIKTLLLYYKDAILTHKEEMGKLYDNTPRDKNNLPSKGSANRRKSHLTFRSWSKSGMS
jgi:hypothetical protein